MIKWPAAILSCHSDGTPLAAARNRIDFVFCGYAAGCFHNPIKRLGRFIKNSYKKQYSPKVASSRGISSQAILSLADSRLIKFFNKSPCKIIAPQIKRADLAWGFICINIGCPVRGEMLAFILILNKNL